MGRLSLRRLVRLAFLIVDVRADPDQCSGISERPLLCPAANATALPSVARDQGF